MRPSPMADYNVEDPPSSAAWLALDETDRIALIEDAHLRTKSATGGNSNAHATIHALVENRLAMHDEAAVRAYDRFRAAGHTRHATVHALASVVTKHMLAMMESDAPPSEDEAARDFDALDPKSLKSKR